jgi:hypothetical protein
MATESTAINDLISGVQRQPLRREHQDDWLFGSPDDLFVERGDPTQIDPNHDEKSTTPYDKATPVPQAASPYPRVRVLDYPQRSQSPTTHVRIANWTNIAKKVALPIGLFSIVVVLLGVYFAKTGDAKSAPAVQVAAASMPAPPAPPSAEPAPMPAATPDVAQVAEPKVEVEAHAVEVVAAPEPVAEAAPSPAQTDVLIEPGSPASRFLPTAEPTVPTVPTVAPKAAPAPQTIPDLPPPAAKPAPVERPVVAKSASRAAPKRTVKAAKPRAQKKVAAVAKAAPAKATGKGVLSLSSTPSMNVWVDGRNSGAQTPVRIILLAGTHKVSLLDRTKGTAKSFDVVIKPDQTTKITKSY